jgi:hypothetical protein
VASQPLGAVRRCANALNQNGVIFEVDTHLVPSNCCLAPRATQTRRQRCDHEDAHEGARHFEKGIFVRQDSAIRPKYLGILEKKSYNIELERGLVAEDALLRDVGIFGCLRW